MRVSLINCPKLDLVEIELIPSLRVLHIQECSVAVLRIMVGVSSSIIRLFMSSIKGLTQLHKELLERLQAVEYLQILDCDELIYLWKSEVEAYKILASLQKLEISRCLKLLTVEEKRANLMISVKSFREVEVSNCPRLESYYCPNSIEKLKISSCRSITSLIFPTVDDLPPPLKILNIEDCNKLDMSWLHNKFLSSLESLVIYKMSNLRFFPEGCFVHLTTLIISNCDNIESIPDKGLGFLPFFCL